MTRLKKGVRPTSKGPILTEDIAFEFDHHVASDFAVVVMINNDRCSKLLAPHCAKLGSLDRMEDFMKTVGLMVAVGKKTRHKIQSRCKDDEVLTLCANLADQVSTILHLNRYGEF